MVVGCLLFGVKSVDAALWKGYGGTITSIQAPTVLAPGASGEVRVTVKNTGEKSWKRTSADYVSLYHWDPTKKVERSSVLTHAQWDAPERPKRLPVEAVLPGGQLTWTFPIQAPSVSGAYTGNFIMAAEGVAWLKGTQFRVDIRVQGAAASVTSGSSAPQPSAVTVPSNPATAANAASYVLDTSGTYQARIGNGGGLSWTVEAGQDMSVLLAFVNTGAAPWPAYGADAFQLMALDTNDRVRESVFAHPSWNSKSVLAPLVNRVSLGGDASFSVKFRAPDTAGSYIERFSLVTASGKRVPGALIELPITVNPGSGFVATDVSDLTDASAASAPTPADTLPVVPVGADEALKATSFASSLFDLSLLGNGRQQITVGWRNAGTEEWKKVGVRLVSSEPWVRASWLADPTWSNGMPPEGTISAKTGETAFHSFYVKAPPKRGTYLLKFRLFANGRPVQGGDVQVTVRVTTDGAVPRPDSSSSPTPPKPSVPSTPASPPLAAQPLTGDVSTLPSEPMIRAGIYQPPQGRLQVRSLLVGADVRVGGSSVCTLSVGQLVTISYDKATGVYTLTGDGGCSGSSRLPYQVKAQDGSSPLEIADFVRPSTWISNATDNKFRGQLELRASNDQKELWVINELPIEWYLKGIAETSNVSPAEFQRTLLVAARTYAMYHVNRQTKHANRGFTVEATLDQLYRGYAIEQRAPNIAAAVDATRGQIVTHGGSLAITPYFSRSDGRTRSWGEVWAGGSNYPWLVSVPVPEDQGRTLWGHGVGMSASGALSMANNGKDYATILKHFYSGIEIMRAYR